MFAVIQGEFFFIPRSSIADTTCSVTFDVYQFEPTTVRITAVSGGRSILQLMVFLFSDELTISQEFQREIVVMPTNGMTNGEEHNGIGLAVNHLKCRFVASPSRLVADGRSLFLRAISEPLRSRAQLA